MTKSEFKSRFKRIFELLVLVNESYSYTRALNTLEDREYLILKKYLILDNARVNFWRVTVLDVCTLLHKDSKYGIFKLFNLIENNFNSFLPENTLQLSQVRQWRTQLENDFKNTIDKFFILRDKHYAHQDNLSFDPSNMDVPSLKEIDELLEWIDDVARTLYSIIFEISINPTIFKRDSTDFLIQDLLLIEDSLRDNNG